MEKTKMEKAKWYRQPEMIVAFSALLIERVDLCGINFVRI